MKHVVQSMFSDRTFARLKAALDEVLPFVLLLLTLLIVFQFVFPVTAQFQEYVALANWSVIAYFAVRLAVDYRLAAPDEDFWKNHWMDIIMVVPLFSALQEARLAGAAEEVFASARISEHLAITSALRNSQTAAQITRITRIIKRSISF